MEWFFPFKTTLFASKSVTVECPPQLSDENDSLATAIEDISAAAATEPPSPLPVNVDEKEDEEETNQLQLPTAQQQQHQQVRRRSSLSDLDVLLLRQKREKQTLSSSGLFPVEHKRSALLLAVGSIGGGGSTAAGFEGGNGGHALANRCSSIGDMINLKLYGSNRSIVSMTSSIAESVPLETVHNNNSSNSGGAATVSKPPPTIDEDEDQDQDQSIDDFQSSTQTQLSVQEKQLAAGIMFLGSGNRMEVDDDDAEGLGPLSTDTVGTPTVSHGVPTPPPLPHQRTPSVTERAQRLSRLIQNRQCRCSRYQQEQDLLGTASSSGGGGGGSGSCPGRPFTAPAANALLLTVTCITQFNSRFSSHRFPISIRGIAYILTRFNPTLTRHRVVSCRA